MAEGLAEKVDLILVKLSKLDKLDAIEQRVDSLASSVASIEDSVSKLERDVADLESKAKTTDLSVSELRESLNFCEEEISDMKKNACDLKESCSSNMVELRKQILYLETYNRRENLKFVGIPNRVTFRDTLSDDNDESSENTVAVIYKFIEDELLIKDRHKKIEFQCVHRLGKQSKNGPRPILARFLRYFRQ